MKLKEEKGLTGIDIAIMVIAVIIFSTLIFSLIYNNTMENMKLKKEALAMIYMTEIFENIAIEPYNSSAYNGLKETYVEIKTPNVFVPKKIIDNYKVEMAVTTDLDGVTDNQILKKIKLKLTYKVGEKTYTCSMQRMKIKE